MIRFKLKEIMQKNNIARVSQLVEITKKYHFGGIDRRTLSRIKSGTVDRIDMFVLDVLCSALECSIADLIEYVSSDEGTHKIRPSKKQNTDT